MPLARSLSSASSRLFSKFTFYLSRETPRQPLELLLKAFGCKRVGWDAVLGDGAFTTNELDPAITHQIVDRPPVQVSAEEDGADVAAGDKEDNQTSQKLATNRRVPGRIYVQPQWVWDSVNDGELKETHLYAPGASLPPHLSPFVKSTNGAYDPTIPLAEQEPEAEALEDDEEEVDEDGDLAVKTADGDVAESDEDEIEDPDMDVDDMEDDEDDDDEEDVDEITGGLSDEDEEDSEGEDDKALQRQMELEAELQGASVKSKQVDAKAKAKQDARKALSKKSREEAEDNERAKGMLSKKKRKLYEQMVYTNNKKSAEDQKLRAKRRKLEKEKAKGKA